MYIRKRGKKGYEISVSGGFDSKGKRVVHSITYKPETMTPTGKPRSEAAIKKDVEMFAVDYERRVLNGEQIAGKDYIFRDFVENVWLPEWAEMHLTIRSKESYLNILENNFMVPFGKKKLNSITTLDIQAIINAKYREGRSVKTLKRYECAINSIFRYAYKMSIVNVNPCDRLDMPVDKNKKEVKCFDADQIVMFLNILDEEYVDHYSAHERSINGTAYHVPAYDEVHYVNNMWKAFFYMSVATGMRRGELCALKWTDIDFEHNKVSITKSIALTKQGAIVKDPKTQSSIRELTLPEVCIPYLVDWYEEEKNYYLANKDTWAQKGIEDYEDNFIFIQKDGRMMHPTTPSNKFREIIMRHNERADDEHQLPLINLHALRHSSASLLIESGVDLLTVSKRMGHSKISTTLDIYTHRLKKDDHEAADAMEKIMGKRGK